jgi:hypothetical protein
MLERSRLTLAVRSAHNTSMAKHPKRPRDINQLAKMIVDISTGNAPPEPEPTKNPAAVALGKLGGAKGGPARAAALSPAKRRAIAKKAAAKRWNS